MLLINYETIEQEFSGMDASSPEFVRDTGNNGFTGYAGKVRISGKFLYAGDKKFYIKGVTYGAFRPDEKGEEYTDIRKIERDFAMMSAHGLNTVRIPHTTPSGKLLDIAHGYNLKVMVGLSAEQLVGYLIDRKKAPGFRNIIQEKVRRVAGHPAVLCFAIGNEIPASIVRWIGRKKIERFLKKVYKWVKEIDPVTPVTYVNYPTTEYLQLDFLDFICFNVYLESPENFSSYLFHLQNIAGDRPLIMGEIGLDCIRNGEKKQAEFIRWQIPTAFASGCAGVFIFSWTDEWFRGGQEVYDWAFGLTDKDRNPKPSLQLLPFIMCNVPFGKNHNWPFISVVICTYNGSKTIRQTLAALRNLTYLNYEVIVVNDGSTDETLEIVSEFDVNIVNSTNKGLSHARNLGLHAAKGEIVAYIDDDAFPDPDWLLYLAYMFTHSAYAAIGGPNLEPEDACFISNCINHTPGIPTHILISSHEAEHIPGCNMAIRKDWLLKIGGFDSRFRIAGDDVDICWKIQEAGGKIGFAAGAFVWHHRRDTIKKFWNQQQGYGKSEALLEKKWPEKFNRVRHMCWKGKIYGDGSMDNLIFRYYRIYHGTWGLAPFQSIYGNSSGSLLSVTLMPEWYLVAAALFMLGLLGISWPPMLFVLFLAVIATLLPLLQVINKVSKISAPKAGENSFTTQLKFKSVIVFLHIVQPLARLWGRMKFELTPWRKFGPATFDSPFSRTINIWCTKWVSPETRLELLEKNLKCRNRYMWRGGAFDRWDLKMKGGEFGMASICMAAEDHREGCQYLRFRLSPIFTNRTRYLLGISFTCLIFALIDSAWMPASLFGLIAVLVIARAICDCSIATRSFSEVILDQKNV